jgi:hypothetical protein
MKRTLPVAREGLVASIIQDTAGTDRPRLIAVLDALIEWSLARPQLLAFRVTDGAGPLVSFEHKQLNVVFWAARLTRGAGPRLEIFPPTGRALSDTDRTLVMETLNAHSREVLVEGDRLRISFGALKNVAARTAVLDLLDQLLGAVAHPA